MTPGPPTRAFLLPASAIALFNALLIAPLFLTERVRFNGSIEGAFIGLARFFSENFNPFGWYPFWYGGTPVQFTYTPGLHYLNALMMRLAPALEPGQVYHAVCAAMYSLGAATAAYLAYRLTGARGWAFAAGMLISLSSPAVWLVRELRGEWTGFPAPWRLQVLVKWGEGPHTAALALLPLAICALWMAVHRRGFPPLVWAAVLLAATVLINWVGAFALGVVFFCLLLALSGRWPDSPLRPRLARALAAGVLAYLLAAFWISPAFVRTVAFNAQSVSGPYHYRLAMLGILAGALAGMIAIRLAFRKFPERRYLCFLSLNAFFFGYLTLAAYWLGWHMIPQPHRYVPEFELFLILLACEAARLAPRRIQAAAVAALAVLSLWQARYFLTSSWRLLRPAVALEWPEYRLGHWLSRNVSPDNRVFILGSEGMSLNGWFNVAQVKGWFDPGVRDQLVLGLSFQIGSGMNAAAGREGAIAVDLLKALGARYVVVHSPKSALAYHDFPNPAKFEGLLPAVYRLSAEETIYEVPGVRLASLVREGELPARAPAQGLDLEPLARYLAALGDAERPALETRWISPNQVEVSGEFPAGMLVSLRVSHDEGWQVFQGGEKIRAWRDPLGFLAIEPYPEPLGRLRLRYVGSPEQRFCGWVSLLTLGGCVAACLASRFGRIR